mgnify:CR=1 FL=1
MKSGIPGTGNVGETLDSEIGIGMVDAGLFASTRLLESLAMLRISLAFWQGLGLKIAFGLLRR